MPSRRYQYDVVRYVPNLVRDEALNVGVVVQDVETHDTAFKLLPRNAAIRRMWPDSDERIVSLLQGQLGHAVEGDLTLGDVGKPSDPEFLGTLAYEFTGTIQFTAPRGTTAGSLDTVTQNLFNTYVAEPAAFRPINYTILAPSRLQSRVWNAFEKRNLIHRDAYQKKISLPGRIGTWTFDLGMQSEESALVISSIALNTPAPEAKAGRAFVLRGMVEDIRASMDLDATAVMEPPKNEEDMRGIDVAKGVLEDANITVVNVRDLQEYADGVKVKSIVG